MVEQFIVLSQLSFIGWRLILCFVSPLFVLGSILSWVIQYPKYSASDSQNELFEALIFKPVSDNLVRACSILSKCTSKHPSYVSYKLFKKVTAKSSPAMNLLIFSWRMLRLLHSPIESSNFELYIGWYHHT